VISKSVRLEWYSKGNLTWYLARFNKLDIQDFTYSKNPGPRSKSDFAYFK
jgi:hypothetical protein